MSWFLFLEWNGAHVVRPFLRSEANHTKSRPSTAASRLVFWETIKSPGLEVACTNCAKARGIVRRSCETKTRPSRAAKCKTAESDRDRRPAFTAVRKSRFGLTPQNSPQNIFIEVGICVESYLHRSRIWLTFSFFS